ncbi:PAS domain S-box protein [Halopiger aswanensis]|uniref:histidine kinase n=1 Tax=Halopiger aswanensis TaxID=148449 RepID=A0A419WSL8_9EURY|nr:PAS domain S-box protein [Halopiger aswanensis]RKD98408.1 PAS domain S-box-containing protein [Halopiger aswanensis]
MGEYIEQFVGALFRVLEDEGHTEAKQLLLDVYRSNAATDRDELAQDLLSELIAVVDRRLETREEIEVLATAVESLFDRFATVVDAAPAAIFAVEPDGSIRLWNDGATRTFGWDESEIIDRSYPRTLAESPDETAAFLERLREGEHLAGIETRHRHRDGSVRDVRLWAAPLGNRGNEFEFEGATFVVSDITEQKQREQRLAVLNRVLRHNIRNDVTLIQGHLEMLAADLEAETEHVDVIDARLDNIVELSEAARRIEQLQGDGTDLATIELTDLLRERLDRLQTEHPEADISVQLPGSVAVGAHELLPYAFDNVLENAIEHNTAATPRIDVTVTTASGPHRRTVTVRIADNGPGLPEAEREVLTADAETPLTHSSGMGLWLVRWIVRSSNGTVAVDPGRFDGTCVSIRLQDARSEDRREAAPSARR